MLKNQGRYISIYESPNLDLKAFRENENFIKKKYTQKLEVWKTSEYKVKRVKEGTVP